MQSCKISIILPLLFVFISILTHVCLNFLFLHIFLLFILAEGSIVCQLLTLSLPLVTLKYLNISSLFMWKMCLQVGMLMARFKSHNIAQMVLSWHCEFLIILHHGSKREKWLFGFGNFDHVWPCLLSENLSLCTFKVPLGHSDLHCAFSHQF